MPAISVPCSATRPVGSDFRTSDFDFDFPREAIAQHPLRDRGASRMLELERESGAVRHRRFRDFPSLLEAGDVLVVNASRVIPARLTGQRENGGEAEILLVHAEPDGTWLAMVHPGGKLQEGRTVHLGDDAVAPHVEGQHLARHERFAVPNPPTERVEYPTTS